MMNKFKQWLRDKWRGYTDADMLNVKAGAEMARLMGTSHVITLSAGESAAVKDMAKWINLPLSKPLMSPGRGYGSP